MLLLNARYLKKRKYVLTVCADCCLKKRQKLELFELKLCYLWAVFMRREKPNFVLILDTVTGKERGLIFCKQGTDCRSAEVNYLFKWQHAVHIKLAMLRCLLLPMFHENLHFWKRMKGEAMRYCTPKEKFNYSKPACEDVLLQIQHQAIPDDSLSNPSTSKTEGCCTYLPSNVPRSRSEGSRAGGRRRVHVQLG